MSFLSGIAKFLVGTHSGFFVIFVLPILLLVGILMLCKMFNFTMMPEDFQGKTPKKFKLPKLSREKQGRMYKWSITDGEDDTDGEDFGEYEEPPTSTKSSSPLTKSSGFASPKKSYAYTKPNLYD